MSFLLELLGKGMQTPLMSLVLPHSEPLRAEEVKVFQEMIGDDPAFAASKLRLAIHYSQTGALDKAESILEGLLAANPEFQDAHLTKAAMYAANGELDQAIESLQLANRDNPDDSRILYCLGHCFERLGNTDKALYFYMEGCKCKPYLRILHQRLAAIYLVRQDYPRLTEQMLILQQKHPEDIWNYLVLGQVYLLTQDYQQAETSFERALTIEPDNFEMHDEQVETLANAGRVQEAIVRMQQIIQKQGDFPDSYVLLGDLYSRLGEDAEAVTHYRKALHIHPGYLEAAVKLGTQHLRMTRLRQAADWFNRAVEINDRLVGAYVGLGLAQYYAGKTAQANDTFNLADSLEPNTNLLFAEVNKLQYRISHAFRQQANPLSLDITPPPPAPKAEGIEIQMEQYRRKLGECPNHANLNYNYALLLRNYGKIEQAISYFRRALEVNPSFFKARVKLGLTLQEVNQKKEALDHLKQAFQPEQDFFILHYQLGLMYCDKIKFALAVENFEATLKESNQDTSDVEANLAVALQNMELVDRAAATWRFICELEPQSPMAFHAQRSIMTAKHPML